MCILIPCLRLSTCSAVCRGAGGQRRGLGTRAHAGDARTLRSVLQGERKEKKKVRNAHRNERSQGRSLLRGHGTFSTSNVGGWRLAVVGGWRLVVPGGRPQGLLLTKKKTGLVRTALRTRSPPLSRKGVTGLVTAVVLRRRSRRSPPGANTTRTLRL